MNPACEVKNSVWLKATQLRGQSLYVPGKIALRARHSVHFDPVLCLQMSMKVSGKKTSAARDQDPHDGLPRNSARRCSNTSSAFS